MEIINNEKFDFNKHIKLIFYIKLIKINFFIIINKIYIYNVFSNNEYSLNSSMVLI